MSKIHSKDNSLYGDIASTAIAGQLEARLKELERNIAVAHQFIKLADECYGQVRREWELLHQDAQSTSTTNEFPQQSSLPSSTDEDTFEEIPSFKEKKPHSSHEKKDKNFKSFGSTTTHTPSLGSKPETAKENGDDSGETKSSEPAQKEPRTSRHKKGKH